MESESRRDTFRRRKSARPSLDGWKEVEMSKDDGDKRLGERVGWPSAVVGVSLVLTVGAITVTAIVTYDSVDEALKFWSALSGLVGIITGAFVTYFFTRGTVQQAQQQVAAQEQAVDKTQEQARELQVENRAVTKALSKVAGELSPGKWEELKEDPTVAKALEIP
jgi:hypothetical protein